MENLKKPSLELSKEDAINRIGYIKQKVGMMGANDFEIPALMELMEKVEKGEKNPNEAVSEAQKILNSKQDYH